MKATELQIGDFVYANIYLYDPNNIPQIIQNPVKVIEIGTNVVVEYIFENTIKNYILPLERLIPIQLTAEILEKNGFDNYRGNLYNLQDPSLALNIEQYGYELGQDFGSRFQPFITINYVHELQNALRLCGLNELADSIII